LLHNVIVDTLDFAHALLMLLQLEGASCFFHNNVIINKHFQQKTAQQFVYLWRQAKRRQLFWLEYRLKKQLQIRKFQYNFNVYSFKTNLVVGMLTLLFRSGYITFGVLLSCCVWCVCHLTHWYSTASSGWVSSCTSLLSTSSQQLSGYPMKSLDVLSHFLLYQEQL